MRIYLTQTFPCSSLTVTYTVVVGELDELEFFVL